MAITAALATPARYVVSGTTDTSASFNVAAGDLLCVYVVEADGTSDVTYTPTNSGTPLTWTKQVNVFASNNCSIEMWTAYSVGAITGTTVTVNVGEAGKHWRWGVVAVKGSRAPTSITITIPDVPSIGTSTLVAYTSASTTFAPGATGGETPTFEAISTPGSLTGSSSGSPISVAGLTPGTSYTFKVRARNSAGASAYSAASNAVTATSPPSSGDVYTIGSADWIQRIYDCSHGSNGDADYLYPHGVPLSYDWQAGARTGASSSGFGAGTGWGQIYLATVGSVASTTFDVTNFKVWMRTNGSTWVRVQFAGSPGPEGGSWSEDFTNMSGPGIPTSSVTNGTRTGPLPSGFIWHFWPPGRFTIPSGFDGKVITSVEIKQNSAGGPYCAGAAGDWWTNLTSGSNNDWGMPRHRRLIPGTAVVMGYTNCSVAELTASHPTS